MIDVTELMGVVFSGLSALVIEGVEDAGEVIVVRARTRDGAVACPGCGSETARVHGYYERTAADVPVDGRRVVVRVRVRRMRCPALGCRVQTFREQVPGVLERYQRRISRLTAQVSAVARELAGRASARLLPALGVVVSRHTALRVLLKVPLPGAAVPRVLGIDDFALRRGLVYATVLIDAETGRRVDVVPGRTTDVAEAWLRDHPGVEVLCRDGSGAYGEAARRALPQAVQVSDRWHLWHLLGEAARKEVLAHSCCWAKGTPLQEGKRADTTRERWQQVRDLREKGAGLLDCSRRLGLSLNTVKRYDRASEPERLQRVPKYKPTLVDPHRDYLRKRRAEEPGIAVQQLLREIRERGYQGSSNLLVRYINQGRLDGGRPHLSPRRATRLLLTRPDRLTGSQQETLARIETACPEISALASHIRDFAALLVPDPGNAGRLQEWITAARAADLPHVHAFTRGLDLDIQAAAAALTMPFHNGRTEGVNTKTKMIKRQMYGRAGFALLRHRILLGLRNVTTGSETEPPVRHALLSVKRVPF
jgi:transposase